MNKEEIDKLIGLRAKLIKNYNKLKDYKQNKNAIMREIDHAKLLHETVVSIDNILNEYVNFETWTKNLHVSLKVEIVKKKINLSHM